MKGCKNGLKSNYMESLFDTLKNSDWRSVELVKT